MKKRIIIGNWKTNKTKKDVEAFMKVVNAKMKTSEFQGTFGVAPVFVHLELAKKLAPKKMEIVAQDANACESGAYTGTVSWSQLKDIGVKYVIIGHSERRMYYNETDEVVNEKVNAVLTNKMVPILCIGENLTEFNKKQTNTVCGRQLKQALKNIKTELLSKLIIAYEPVWAIGTGKTATPEIAQTTIAYIRKQLAKIAGADLAKKIPILYGGSVKPSNIEVLMKQPDINGALVGGASLDPNDYLKLLGIK